MDIASISSGFRFLKSIGIECRSRKDYKQPATLRSHLAITQAALAKKNALQQDRANPLLLPRLHTIRCERLQDLARVCSLSFEEHWHERANLQPVKTKPKTPLLKQNIKRRGPRGKYKPRKRIVCQFMQKQAALRKKYADKPDTLAEQLLDLAGVDDPARRAALLHIKDLITESLRPPPGRTRLAQAYPEHYSRVLNPKARQHTAKQELKTILEERLASPKLRPLARVVLSMIARNRKSVQQNGRKISLKNLLAEPAARDVLKTLVSLLAVDRS